MNKKLRFLSMGIILIFFFSACSIEKRLYTPGYNVQWNNSKAVPQKNKAVQNNKSGREDKPSSAEKVAAGNKIADETATTSVDNSNAVTYHSEMPVQKSIQHASALPEECDIITLKNGDEIKAKVIEISKDEIKYKKCEDINGQTLILKKSDVFMIKYPNGTKDIIAQDNSVETQNKPVEKEDSGVFGILSFATICISALVSALGGATALFILLPVALVFAVIGLGRNRKLKGFSIVTLSVIGGFILLILLYALTYESTNCFSAGTKILMADHTQINIESIIKGDSVMTYDFKCNRLIKAEVGRLIIVRHFNLFKLTFDQGEITVTDDHPFWVAAKGWTSLNPGKSNNNYRQENSITRLTIGDSLFLPADNKFTKLQNILLIEKEQLTYTIELKEGNNFIANGLLVKTEQAIKTEENIGLTSYFAKSKQKTIRLFKN